MAFHFVLALIIVSTSTPAVVVDAFAGVKPVTAPRTDATPLSAATLATAAVPPLPTSPKQQQQQRRTLLQESVENEDSQQEKFHRLYQHVAVVEDSKTEHDDDDDDDDKKQPPPLLGLRRDEHGYRGVYVNRNVREGDTVLSIPLPFCLRDDAPPQWFQPHPPADVVVAADDDDASSFYHANYGGWATRLAASVLDNELLLLSADASSETSNNNNNKINDDVHELWKSLLPNPAFLRASLPVHWSDDILKEAASTALELAVDTSYFARARSRQDLLDALLAGNFDYGAGDDATELSRICDNALDLVQTRSCRVNLQNDEVRLLAPVFDFINHSPMSNCEFVVRDDCLLVRAKGNIASNCEVLIDYGSSARPAWKCLSSYGFVLNTVEEDSVAEVFMDGQRYEVGPTTIPEDMVADAADTEDNGVGDDASTTTAGDNNLMELTPEIAIHLGTRVSDSAFNLLLDPWKRSRDYDDDGGAAAIVDYHADNKDDDETRSAEEILSSKLAASLRFHQHRILLACSMGLRDWAVQQQQQQQQP